MTTLQEQLEWAASKRVTMTDLREADETDRFWSDFNDAWNTENYDAMVRLAGRALAAAAAPDYSALRHAAHEWANLAACAAAKRGGSWVKHKAAVGKRDKAKARFLSLLSAAPQPAVVKQDLKTAQPEAKAGADDSHYGVIFDAVKASVREIASSRGWQSLSLREQEYIAGRVMRDLAAAQPKPAEGGSVAVVVYVGGDGGGKVLSWHRGMLPWINSVPVGTTLHAEPPAAATRAEEVEALAKAVLDARSHIGPCRPDDREDAAQWDALTEAARRLAGKGE